MNIEEFIEEQTRSANLGPLYEAAGPDAWNDPRTIIREIATAIANDDAQALMLAMRDPFLEYMQKVAEQEGVDIAEPDREEAVDIWVKSPAGYKTIDEYLDDPIRGQAKDINREIGR